MISKRNIRCLATVGKHFNNNGAIARQLLGKRVPVETVSMQQRGTKEIYVLTEISVQITACLDVTYTVHTRRQNSECSFHSSF
jgi:hypothetical protein